MFVEPIFLKQWQDVLGTSRQLHARISLLRIVRTDSELREIQALLDIKKA